MILHKLLFICRCNEVSRIYHNSFAFSCCIFHANASNWRFHHFSVNDGLSQGNVTAMASDYLGVMWIGTWDGLNVYDGFNNTIYTEQTKSKHSFKGSLVNSIHESSEQVMFVATSSCLNEYQRYSNSFKSYSIHQSAQDYRIIAEERDELLVSIDLTLWTFHKKVNHSKM